MKKCVICYSIMQTRFIQIKFVLIMFAILLFASCTFDYGESSAESESPDLVMESVEYVRVRSSDPIARFMAERAERYEKQGVMKLQNFVFEQYGEKGEEVNAVGKAGFASVQIESGDIFMNNGVRIEVESEKIILETNQLEWKDEPRTLSSGNEQVTILQNSGTSFTGTGLIVNTRPRTFEFTGLVYGKYIPEEDKKETEDEDDETGEQKPETAELKQQPKEQRPENVEWTVKKDTKPAAATIDDKEDQSEINYAK